MLNSIVSCTNGPIFGGTLYAIDAKYHEPYHNTIHMLILHHMKKTWKRMAPDNKVLEPY
jgi:hypothetical protein